MKLKIIFKIGSILSLIGFYLMILLGIFVLLEGISRLWMPGSALAESFGPLDPIFSYIEIDFNQSPALYSDTEFITLYLVNMLFVVLTGLLFSWYMFKLLKNIYHDSLFMYANVSIFFKLGMTVGLIGTVPIFAENRMLSAVLPKLDITNATISNVYPSYIETIFGGIVLILIAAALKIAVHAVEENKKTI